jgi:hypothetical protein
MMDIFNLIGEIIEENKNPFEKFITELITGIYISGFIVSFEIFHFYVNFSSVKIFVILIPLLLVINFYSLTGKKNIRIKYLMNIKLKYLILLMSMVLASMSSFAVIRELVNVPTPVLDFFTSFFKVMIISIIIIILWEVAVNFLKKYFESDI